MPTDQDKLAAARRQRAKEIDEDIAAFGLALTGLLGTWREHIGTFLNHEALAHVSSLQLMTYLESQIRASLQATRYHSLIDQTVMQYQEAWDAANGQLALLGIHSNETPTNHSDLSALQQVDISRLSRAAEDAVASIAESSTVGIVTAQTAEDIAVLVDRHIDAFQSSAMRTVDTGMLGADRFAYWNRLTTVTERFKYFGVSDIKNRPFCRARIGKVYTVDEIKKMDNGQGLSVIEFCGGYNCRHVWLAQVD